MNKYEKKLDMRDLTEALISLGYDARYEMTGGNNGTIHLYENSNIYLAIGPSSFNTGEGNYEELNWGSFDNSEDNYGEPIGSSSYFDEELLGREFNVQNVADEIDAWQY